MDVIQYLIERFYSQYIILRDFYINAAAIRSVTTIIAVPNLPTDPPQVCITLFGEFFFFFFHLLIIFKSL